MCPVHHLSSKTQRTKRRLRLATSRSSVYLWIGESKEPIRGFGFIADFSETGLGIYSSEKISKGTMVRVAIGSASGESYRGNIIWCNRYTLEQHFVGRQTMSYRIGIKLVFSSEAERQRYVKLYKNMQESALEIRAGIIF